MNLYTKLKTIKRLKEVKSFCDSISDLQVLIINYNTNNKLITSDVPVISINHFHQQYIEYAYIGLIMLFPITEQQLAVIYDSKMYPRFAKKQYVTISNEKEVAVLNTLQLISADKILLEKNILEFTKFNSSSWAVRTTNREKSSVMALGPSDEKLIQLTMRKVIFDCKLSFAQVANKFQRIPIPCREGIPWEFDKKDLEKIKSKSEIIPQISDYQHKVLCGLTKKQYRKGCKDFPDVLKEYFR